MERQPAHQADRPRRCPTTYIEGGSKVSNPRIHLALISAIFLLSWALPTQADVVTEWNAVTVDCSGNRAGPSGLFDIALVQTAVHDAVQAIQGRFEAYEYENPALLGVGSPAAAAAAAAYGTLVGLYGADNPCLATVTDPAVTYAGDPGLQAGNEAAAALLPLYRPSFALPSDPFLGGTAPGEWRPTPPAFAPGAFRFQTVTAPFVLNRPSQFRPQPPPPLSSVAYPVHYDEVKALGVCADKQHANAGAERTGPLLAIESRCHVVCDRAVHRRCTCAGYRRQGQAVRTCEPRRRRFR